ncbi:hypothetical protein C4F49_06260 [Sphingobacterium sp. KB22]|uniref:Uncharacterized protein n=2 Tax=Sphingobacterium hungaricum TaxID=2082723 RepID=A0A928YPL3_9SPHI|nr:hypothetical protein [Sphingobacterium hungaricum]
MMLLYSLSSTGATVYYHKCAENISVSVLENKKVSHETCNMCKAHKHENKESESTKHTACDKDDNSCKDLQVKIEKVTDKVIQANHLDIVPYLFPHISTLYWINTYNFQNLNSVLTQNSTVIQSSPINIPPDLCVLNNIFRI